MSEYTPSMFRDMMNAISKVEFDYIKDLERFIDLFKLDIGDTILTTNHVLVLHTSMKDKRGVLETYPCIHWNEFIDPKSVFLVLKETN